MNAALLLLVLALPGQDPRWAVVRIPSHGASGTVIATESGRTLVLTCAHTFRGFEKKQDQWGHIHQGRPMREVPIVIDARDPAPGAVKTGGNRLVALAEQLDLALVQMGVGPLPYVCPVAPRGYVWGKCHSVGHDEMNWPAVDRPATPLEHNAKQLITREKPWHGRSGGGLIDVDKGYLVGVVHAYSEPSDHPRRPAPEALRRTEVTPQGRGIYVSHDAILEFLAQYPVWRNTTPANPFPRQEIPNDPFARSPQPSAPIQLGPPRPAPGGC